MSNGIQGTYPDPRPRVVQGPNAPCACGSGRKTKKCHTGGYTPLTPTDLATIPERSNMSPLAAMTLLATLGAGR